MSNTTQPIVESLEERQFMSVTAIIAGGGKLQIKGDSARNSIVAEQQGSRFNVYVERSNGTLKRILGVPQSKVKSVWIDAGGGHDKVDVTDAFNRLCFIKGGDGNDFILGSDQTDDIEGGPGHDEIKGYDGNDLLDGGTGNDKIFAGNGDDYLVGGAGKDTLVGGAGDDEIYAKDGHAWEYVSGGRGNDFAAMDRDMAYPEDIISHENGTVTFLGDVETIV